MQLVAEWAWRYVDIVIASALWPRSDPRLGIVPDLGST